jgi:hypothetical protein
MNNTLRFACNYLKTALSEQNGEHGIWFSAHIIKKHGGSENILHHVSTKI